MAKVTRFERWWLSAWPHRLHIRGYVPKFLKLCPEPFRGEVLEIGAGSGWTSQRILETFPQVELTATDLDPRATKSFRHLKESYGNRLHVQSADVLDLPFDRESFDITIAVDAMHHVDDLSGALQQLLRVLRFGGLLGIADEDQRFVIGPLRWLWPAATIINRDRLVQALKKEGAEIIISEGDVHFSIWARKPYANSSS